MKGGKPGGHFFFKWFPLHFKQLQITHIGQKAKIKIQLEEGGRLAPQAALRSGAHSDPLLWLLWTDEVPGFTASSCLGLEIDRTGLISGPLAGPALLLQRGVLDYAGPPGSRLRVDLLIWPTLEWFQSTPLLGALAEVRMQERDGVRGAVVRSAAAGAKSVATEKECCAGERWSGGSGLGFRSRRFWATLFWTEASDSSVCYWLAVLRALSHSSFCSLHCAAGGVVLQP
ncbi:hypothetical protein TYRP_011665 [Tyrophagus putrescentiae]|nr:hypothetical protein TYRP_011665 [Tyrophagus putrescentiae]